MITEAPNSKKKFVGEGKSRDGLCMKLNNVPFVMERISLKILSIYWSQEKSQF